MVLWYYGIMVLWYYGIMLLVFESFSQHIDSDIAYYERAQRAIHLQHLRLFLLLSDEVACFAGPFLRRGCLGLSYLYFYGMDNFSLPYIVCYRWREFGDITTVGSYSGLRLHTMGAMYNILRPFFTAVSFAIFYPFYFICSRDFIMILWYYAFSI